ncbi:MAG: hypothetical protein V7641_5037 [Blastocatellia bacterium]
MTDPQYSRSKQAAFERAVGKFVELKTGSPVKRRHKPPRNPFKEIKDGWSRVEGALRATVERMRAEGYEDWAIWQDLEKHLPAEFIAFLRSECSAAPVANEPEICAAEVKPNHEEIKVSPDPPESSADPSDEALKSAENRPVSGQMPGFNFGH